MPAWNAVAPATPGCTGLEFLERLTKLEKSTDEGPIFPSPSSGGADKDVAPTASSSPQAQNACSDSLSKKRRISQSTGPQVHERQHSPGSTRHASEAREYIEHELRCNPALSQDRRTVLQLAQKFVGQLSAPDLHRQETGIADGGEVEDNLPPPTLTPELLYMMLSAYNSQGTSQGAMFWPDHISDRTLERMGLAIIEGSEDEQVLQLYRIVVWVRAISVISNLAPTISSERLKAHFGTLKKQYQAAALEDLNSIPLVAPPSLALVQALLSGKRLMQTMGNMSRSWSVTALASQAIVALNYHNITNTTPRDEIEEDIHACVYTCYYNDKTLSLLLLRPPSLPELKVDPAQLVHLDPTQPTTPMIIGIVQYAGLKTTLLKILLETKDMGQMEKANTLSNLMTRAQSIYSHSQIVSSHTHVPNVKAPSDSIQIRARQEQEYPGSWYLLRCHWLSFDFNHYSILSTIIRARSSVLKSRLVCEDCLFSARKALTTLCDLQDAFSARTSSVDSYPYFLTWTMLLVPLSPFFVLFCSVVATSDRRDFEMIKKITDDLRQFAMANASIGKVYRLFSKFLDLCAPLIKKDPRTFPPQNASTSADNVRGKAVSRMDSSYPDVFDRTGQNVSSLQSPAMSGGASSVSQSVEGWDDSLMWELFDNQPSLEWADSGLWDSMAMLDAAS
ncbi:hypothetical protein N7492_007655 [Penicillium capsulatum]|uniref:Transcription factor domain-containing protein n=1 Tax=Penicillium capsulatum TaxID=69766 RepID=A0A9W9I070_9EURO|nr:hypothetical protein N7492_007655 [Penicillium capsulatum]KAJ6117489.1 hypothetical protein N7512_007214 [Penicillium capsulatum]